VENRYAITEVQTVIHNPAFMISQTFHFKFNIPKSALISNVALSRQQI
jgi:hypothetical protein